MNASTSSSCELVPATPLPLHPTASVIPPRFVPVSVFTSCSETGTTLSSVTTTTVLSNTRSHLKLVCPSVCTVVVSCLSSERSSESNDVLNWSLPWKFATTACAEFEPDAGPACRVVAPVVAVDDELLTNIARAEV